MANVIIGTAGHIDHGKTTLIRRLTGIDTDRLKEEKKRGITIELGFAYFDLPSGKRAGIVDVPGHERFIKNMLAGASGIDIVLLVVSAEEGFMPQTQEHFDILSLLEVQKGIIVLTKADLVDAEWIEVIKSDIRDKVKGSFLTDAPIIEVSAISGMGIDKLIGTIDTLVLEAEEKNNQAPARMPIDRVFTMTGFGTVVTGTLTDGSIREGDILELFPKDIEARVRRVQVHGKDAEAAYAGQRVAINLANVSKDSIERGDILARKDSLKKSSILDAKISILESTRRTIHNWSRLRLYHGSREVFCRVVLLDRETMEPGETAFVQLRLEEPTACKYGEHFVLRLYSPLETVGGGVILDPNAVRHKRFKEDVIEELHIKNSGNKMELIVKTLMRIGFDNPDINTIAVESGIGDKEVVDLLEELKREGQVVVFDGKFHLHQETLNTLESNMLSVLKQFHEKNPLKHGISKEEMRSKTLKQQKNKIFDEVLEYCTSRGSMDHVGGVLKLHGFEVELDAKKRVKADKFNAMIEEGGFNPPGVKEALILSGISDKEKDLIEFVLSQPTLYKLEDNLVITCKKLEESVILVKEHLAEVGEITMAQFRDKIGSSRKVALPLLEYMDNAKITQRVGDVRVLRK